MAKQMTLEDIMTGSQGGQAKTASAGQFSQEDHDAAAELALLDKVAADMSQDELLKVAGAAKLTGDIIGDVVINKIAQALPYMIANALQKIAVGDSEVISGTTRESQKDLEPWAQRAAEDALGKSEEPYSVRKMLHSNYTQGATAAGGEHSSHQGEPFSNTHGSTVGKMGSQKQAVGEMGGMEGGGGGGGSPEELLQALMAKQQSGQPLSPEEEQLLQQLMQQSGGGGDPGMGAGGGDPGMVAQASAGYTKAQKVQAIMEMLRNRV